MSNSLSQSISSYVASSPWAQIIGQAEDKFSIPSGLLGAQLYQESTLGTQVGNGGGIGQFIPSTAAQYGVDPTDSMSGISGAAEYMSDLYNQTGSWVSALQSYGTLPSNLSGPLTSGQQNVLNIAQAADSGQVQPLSSSSTPTATTGATPATATASTTTSNPQTTGLWSGFENWLSGGFLRVVVAILAVVILMLGFADLAFGMSPKQAVKTVVKTGKGLVSE